MNNQVKGLVYSYIRFSDPRQSAGQSRDRQEAYAAKWAEVNGLRLDESLSMRDEGLSAYHQQHVKAGALGEFFSAIEEGKVPPGSVLVVEGLDRLSRAEPLMAQAQLSLIINAGITVVTAGDNKVYSKESLKQNPMDLVYSLIIMIRAPFVTTSQTTKPRLKTMSWTSSWRFWAWIKFMKLFETHVSYNRIESLNFIRLHVFRCGFPLST